MLRKYFIISLIVCLIPFIAFAGGSSNDQCKTKYPIILAHGMGVSADISIFGLKITNYWYGIPSALEEKGAKVYVTSVNGMDSTINKAHAFKKQFLQIKSISGASKFNIIGHSHGCLYSRYAISNLGLAPYVASHTSYAGPHRGSSVADAILKLVPDSLEGLAGDAVNLVYSFVLGDTNPDTMTNAYDLARDYMTNTFNPNVPNASNVYYQSYAGKIKTITTAFYLKVTNLLQKKYEGDNDGLVSVVSAKWGNFRGVQEGAWWCGGVDHLNEVGHPIGLNPGFDQKDFMVSVVKDLKGRGY